MSDVKIGGLCEFYALYRLRLVNDWCAMKNMSRIVILLLLALVTASFSSGCASWFKGSQKSPPSRNPVDNFLKADSAKW